MRKQHYKLNKTRINLNKENLNFDINVTIDKVLTIFFLIFNFSCLYIYLKKNIYKYFNL